MVEHRTAVPVVIGSNPIVPFVFFFSKIFISIKKKDKQEEVIKEKNRYQGFVVKR